MLRMKLELKLTAANVSKLILAIGALAAALYKLAEKLGH